MLNKKAKIKITLKSDLCAGSGYSYAGIIDSDICYSKNGIPYIPARRIKGCLREAAEIVLGESETEKIFGKSGNRLMGNICIGNAYLDNYADIEEEIEDLKNSGYKNILNTQKVLEQFSSIRAQTAINEETGSSLKNSLRYTRVVNRYSPLEKKELSFISDIEFNYDEKVIENIVKALRHIGINRSRGLGNIKCSLHSVSTCEDNQKISTEISTDEKELCLEYVIKNTTPLMLSGINNNKSEKYIKGQSVIGALASQYLSLEKTSTEDDLFYDLFINGNVKYSNLYIAEKEYNISDKKYMYIKHIPAPLFINKLKKTKKIVNVISEYKKFGDEYNPDGGNLPKKLKDKFISFKDGKISVKEPLFNIVYHHSRKNTYSENTGENNDSKGVFYSLEVIKENQYFSGTIIGKKKYIDFLKKLLDTTSLKFGKSKSAQYGTCKVIETETKIYNYTPEIILKKGDNIIVSFESCGVFQNENGFTVRNSDVIQLTANSLGIKYDKKNVKKSFLQTEIITGYNTVWNLKKPSFSAIQAGSSIIYKVSEDCIIKSEYVGVKNTEGFGKVKIYKYDELLPVYQNYDYTKKEIKPNKCRQLIEKILFKDFSDAIKEGCILTEKINISSSTIGRITLMLDESINNYKENSKGAFDDFKIRIDSIKRKEEKRIIGIFLSAYICKDMQFSIVEEADLKKLDIDINKIIGKEDSVSYNIYKIIKKAEISNIDEKIKGLWGEYLKNILIYQKYTKKED